MHCSTSNTLPPSKPAIQRCDDEEDARASSDVELPEELLRALQRHTDDSPLHASRPSDSESE